MNKAAIEDLHDALQPDSLLERFVYRREANILNKNDFVSMKKTKGQFELEKNSSSDANPNIGFKSLGYSVLESAGDVTVTIVKKTDEAFEFGWRTVDNTATSPEDYTHKQEVVKMTADQKEHEIKVEIIDDDKWNPN